MVDAIDVLGIHGANLVLEDAGGFQDQDYQLARQLTQTVQLADKSKAVQFRERHLVRDWSQDGKIEKFPICQTSLETLGKFGVGLEMYFFFVKQVGFIFFVMGLISICPLVLNSMGDGLQNGDRKQEYDAFTLANQEGPNIIDSDLESAEDELDKIQENYLWVVSADALYTLVFIIFLIVYTMKSKNRLGRNIKNSISAADYALEVKGFPLNGVNEEDLKRHFEQFGDVVEVYAARKYGGLLTFYKKRAQLSLKLGYYMRVQEAKARNMKKKIEKTQKKLDIFDSKIAEKLKNDIKTHDELPIDRVFVVFNKVNQRKECLKAYKDSLRCCRRKKNQPTHLKFQGVYPLKARAAIQPNNVYWENLQTTHCSRFQRRIVSLLAMMVIMVISIAIIFYLKTIQDDLPDDEECAEEEVNGDLDLQEAEEQYTSETEEFCYCKQQSWADLLQEDDLNQYCQNFIQQSTQANLVRFFGSVGVIAINFALKLVLTLLSRYEKMSTKTKEELRIMRKVFLAMFINTSFIILIVNGDFSDFSLVDYLPFNDYILKGDYNDFTRMWYVKVGSTITATMLLSMASPHLINLLVWYPIGFCKRACCWRSYKTQHELNIAFSGPQFRISTKTAQILNVIFSCFLYAGGIPLMNWICCVAMFFIYWSDKILILRHYRKPPLFSHAINDMVIQILPYAIIFHCLFSLYMYGAESIFPTGFHQEGEVVTPDNQTIGDRLSRLSGVVNILLIILTVFVILFLATISKYLNRMVKKFQTQLNDQQVLKQREYRDELINIKEHGLASYNIMNNHMYRPLIQSMNQTAERIRNGEKLEERRQ